MLLYHQGETGVRGSKGQPGSFGLPVCPHLIRGGLGVGRGEQGVKGLRKYPELLSPEILFHSKRDLKDQ